jgi:hypothetical protein
LEPCRLSQTNRCLGLDSRADLCQGALEDGE